MSLPGVAVWHVPWTDKDDTIDWQAYFHPRNRLVAAALHGPDDPKALLTDILKRTVRHLMLMEYSAVALQHMALRDFLAGPEALFPNLATVLGQVRATRAEYDDGRPLDSATQVPPSSLDALASQAFPVPPDHEAGDPQDAGPQRRPQPAHPEPGAPGGAQRNVSSRQAQWFVLVPAGLGDGVDPGRPRRHLPPPRPAAVPPTAATSARLLGTWAREWPELRRRYREAAPHLTSREGWKQIFED